MVTTVGTPQTVAAQELRIESMFPADEETEGEHLILLGQNTLRKYQIAIRWSPFAGSPTLNPVGGIFARCHLIPHEVEHL